MTEEPHRHPGQADRVAERAELLPEERTAGSDDPLTQAQILLEDSDARTEDPEGTKAESSQTPDRQG